MLVGREKTRWLGAGKESWLSRALQEFCSLCFSLDFLLVRGIQQVVPVAALPCVMAGSGFASWCFCLLAQLMRNQCCFSSWWTLRSSYEQNYGTGNLEFTSCICVLRRAVCCHLAFAKIRMCFDSLLSCFLSGWRQLCRPKLGAKTVTSC